MIDVSISLAQLALLASSALDPTFCYPSENILHFLPPKMPLHQLGAALSLE